ncbi:SdrD B-like domain-containing protein [Macrococcoides canis]|uniref:SdrD B-like domain-containing protein n=1 Tax=Macrococcoides canis TaxID=1855823 RepID=UPI0020B68CFF|nr:SdrD B-like domain-containing protein [Macrococcus canis]UTG99907.1 carboxypeptidase regulatory-like domain-containing protein [Macrococcus canis]WBF53103.1 carboxypeptidase regulatory-like domain-containing protein [Macrococcus canis]
MKEKRTNKVYKKAMIGTTVLMMTNLGASYLPTTHPFMNVAQAATNVNSSIVTTQSSITADDTNGNGILDGNSEAITLQSRFSTTGPVSAGDYFTISYSDNISYYQQNPEDTAPAFPTLVDPNTGEVIARSTFDPNTGLVTYTFTDYVNGKENIDMNLYTNLYVDRETVPNKTQDELFSFTLGGVTTSNNIDVQYAPYQNVNGVTSASVFEEVVSRVNNTENPGYYSQTIYVNPINSDLTNVTLDITTNTNAYPGNLANINEATTNIRIFEIADGSTLNESIYFDPNNTTATEVTGNYPVTFNGETATIDFGNTSSTFIVIVEDNLAPTTSETAEVAQLFRISSDQGTITGGNALEFNTSGGIGDGTPTTEEPTTEAPTTEAPTTEAPTTEAPTTEAPTTEAPTTELPTTEAPTTELPTTELPTTEAPTTEAPTTEAPTTEAPTTEAPTTEAPTTEAPTTEAPTTEAPTTEAPTTEAPTTEAPTTEAPTTEAPTTEAPTTEAPTTEAPTTEAPTTELPTTELPTTEAPTTELPTTELPTTELPTTELPTTELPTTEAPTTELPTTELPTTEAPTTELPTTELPTTELPTTELPTTELPTTEAPTTEAPTTEAPTTEAPTTELPTTELPTTEAPTTEAPTTELPTTEAPTTEAPTTEAPTTEAPTTEAPTTEAPTTEAPTTEAPTTEAPTTEAPEKLYDLGNYVWYDDNKDGQQDSNENPVPDVTVILRDRDGNEIDRTTTDENGHYIFENLPNGKYEVEFTNLPKDYIGTPVTSDEDNVDGNSNSQKTSAEIKDADNMTVDFGIVKEEKLYDLGNYVWYDEDKDGIQDAGEKPVPGVTVTLTKPDGTKLTTTTDENGHYIFENLPNGKYEVEFTNLPKDYVGTPVTSDEDNVDGNSNSQKTSAEIKDADNMTVDFGIVKEEKLYDLGNYVWYDEDKDGIQDAGEKPVPGVTVTLTKPDGTKLTTTTDENGHYIFENLPNGKYEVEFTKLPKDYVGTPVTSDEDNVDGNSNSQKTSAEIKDADNMSVDFGIVKEEKLYDLGNYVWYDEDKDGIQDAGEKPVPGVTVTLTKPDGTKLTTTTDENGHYIFENLPNGKYEVEFTNLPKDYVGTPVTSDEDNVDGNSNSQKTSAEIKDADNMTVDFGIVKESDTITPNEPGKDLPDIGDYVWHDKDKDGVQDSNEPGIPGVKVTLKDENGNVIRTTTTDENGKYIFKDVPNGKYEIVFETPKGFTPTEVGKGNQGNDSNGTSTWVTVKDKDDFTLDSGFYKPSVPGKDLPDIGDYVWHDKDKDGVQDSNEPGIPGVKVTLKDEKGNVIRTTTTDENGKYIFKDVPNGKYEIVFETPKGFTPTEVGKGNQGNDSNGTSTWVTVKDKDDFTLDSGFYTPEKPIEGIIETPITPPHNTQPKDKPAYMPDSSVGLKQDKGTGQPSGNIGLPDTGETNNGLVATAGVLTLLAGLALLFGRRK